MNAIKSSLLGAVLCVAAATVLSAQTPVRVTADNVNLRAKAVPTGDVVGQVGYDARLAAFEIGEEWVEVAAPPEADLWVMKSYVQMPGNAIGANRVNVRAGPSINYNVVCTLALGDVVEPRGEEIAEWIKIAPPADARVWISRDFVEILGDTLGETSAPVEAVPAAEPTAEVAAPAAAADEASATDEKKADKPAKKRKSKAKAEAPAEAVAAPAVSPSPADLPTPIVAPSIPEKDVAVREIPVPAPADLKLIPLDGQGRRTEVEGELRAAPLINEAPTRYRVVRWQDNRWQILCHVYGEAAKFRSLQDKRVHLQGRQYWIQGAAAPVLVPDQIREVQGE